MNPDKKRDIWSQDQLSSCFLAAVKSGKLSQNVSSPSDIPDGEPSVIQAGGPQNPLWHSVLEP